MVFYNLQKVSFLDFFFLKYIFLKYFHVYTLIKSLKFDIYIVFIILFGVYKLCFIELKCGFRYSFTKSHQNILNVNKI